MHQRRRQPDAHACRLMWPISRQALASGCCAQVVAGILLCVATGCSSSERPLYPVRGQVTFEGQAVEYGDILFIPADPRWGPEAARIEHGQYTLQAAEGEHRVEITALDIGPHTKYLDGSPLAKNMIPERFNLRSELKAQVAPGDNTHDFNLPNPARSSR